MHCGAGRREGRPFLHGWGYSDDFCFGDYSTHECECEWVLMGVDDNGWTGREGRTQAALWGDATLSLSLSSSS